MVNKKNIDNKKSNTNVNKKAESPTPMFLLDRDSKSSRLHSRSSTNNIKTTTQKINEKVEKITNIPSKIATNSLQKRVNKKEKKEEMIYLAENVSLNLPKKQNSKKILKSDKNKENNIQEEANNIEKVTEEVTEQVNVIDEDKKEVIDISKFINNGNLSFLNEHDDVILKCTKIGSKLRVRILTSGYYNDANCQFPKSIRVDGRYFKTKKHNVNLKESSGGKYFYNIMSNIEVIDELRANPHIKKLITVFEDKSSTDCNICMCEPKSAILIPCGHFYTCMECSKRLDKCPICRSKIIKTINKKSMD